MEECFFDAFKNMDRLGPGSDESTNRAMKWYTGITKNIRILDIGCGRGCHTFLLAEQFPKGHIIAIDNYEPNIEQVNNIAQQKGLSDRVHGITMSMFEMTFHEESFDLIWSEGAIYIMGFTEGLRDWRRFLKPDGFLICSEISWLTDSPSKESYKFWHEGYTQIDTVANKIKQIELAKYLPVGHFICPVTDWTINYYDCIQKNINTMKEAYDGIKEVTDVVNMLREEILLYKQYRNEYSYVFYAMKKI